MYEPVSVLLGVCRLGLVGQGNRVMQARAAALSGRSAARKRVADAREQFEFVPSELVAACLLLIQRYHARPEAGTAADTVWKSDAREMLQHNAALGILFKYACGARGAKQARRQQEAFAALILAFETLVSDLGQWSGRFPEAKHKAEELVGKVPRRRRWLVDTYGYPLLDA